MNRINTNYFAGGLVVGIAIGLALHSLAAGIAIGVAVGLFVDQEGRKNKKENEITDLRSFRNFVSLTGDLKIVI